MEVDDREVRGPGDLRDLGDAELVGVPAGRERDARRLDPLGPLLGHALLVDHLALDAVREAAQLRRPLVERAHDPLADREVVVDEVALRLLPRRKEHLVRVRHLDDRGRRPRARRTGTPLRETVPRGRFESAFADRETRGETGHAQGSDSARGGRARRSRRPPSADGASTAAAAIRAQLRQGEPRTSSRTGSSRSAPTTRPSRRGSPAARRRAGRGRSTTPPRARASSARSPTPSPKQLGFAEERGRLGLHAVQQVDRAGQEGLRLRHQPDLVHARAREGASTSATRTTTSTSRSSALQGQADLVGALDRRPRRVQARRAARDDELPVHRQERSSRDQSVAVYDTNDAAVAALKNGQIDGLVVDLPTAFYVTAVQVPNGNDRRPVRGRRATRSASGWSSRRATRSSRCVNNALAQHEAHGR